MKKRNFLTTAVLAALVAAQMAMPVMAAKTNNKLDKIDDTQTDFTAGELKQSGHTTFGVIEADKVGSNQLSVEVPLYVTMAATSNTHDMIVPTLYEIKNTGKPVYGDDGHGNTVEVAGKIGVTAITTSTTGDNTWTITDAVSLVNSDSTNDQHKMSFSLGNHEITAADSTIYDDYTAVNNANSQFVTVDTNDQSNNTLVAINPNGGTLAPKIASTIASVDRSNGTGKTVGVVKVKYQFAALDENNKPITANTYVGDNKTDAGYDD